MKFVNSVIIYILTKVLMGAPVGPLFSSTSLNSFNLDLPLGCGVGAVNCGSRFGAYPEFTQEIPQPLLQGQPCIEGQQWPLPQPTPQQQPQSQSFQEQQPQPQPQPFPEKQPLPIPQPCPEQQPQPQPIPEQQPQPIPQAPCPRHLAANQNAQSISINQNNY